MTEFSKTFPVFYKWPDLTDVQVMLTGTVVVKVFMTRSAKFAQIRRRRHISRVRFGGDGDFP